MRRWLRRIWPVFIGHSIAAYVATPLMFSLFGNGEWTIREFVYLLAAPFLGPLWFVFFAFLVVVTANSAEPFPIMPPLGGFVSYALVALLGYVLIPCFGRRRFDIGFCEHCGYDLRATPERCPECGLVTQSANSPQ